MGPHQRGRPAKQHHGRKSGHRATEDPTDAAATDAASEAWTAQSRAACGHESSHEAGRKGCKGCKGSRGKEGSKPEATKSRGGEASRGRGLGKGMGLFLDYEAVAAVMSAQNPGGAPAAVVAKNRKIVEQKDAALRKPPLGQ